MSPALTERIVEIAQQARLLRSGEKTPFYEKCAQELGISRATLMRKISGAAFSKPRRRRSDSGQSALPKEEADTIAAWIKANVRNTGKELYNVERAVETLRANGKIIAGKVDKATGEITPLSISAIRRALKAYGLDTETLNAPPPAVQMASRHPNHVWEIDASICVLYYLPKDGLAVMDAAEFEKNKPDNFKRIEKERVWRYAVVDHCTGAIYVEYVFGGESGANLSQIFINATQQRGNNPFYGVPFMIYVDAGCANTGAIFKNLCRSLQIDLRWHLPGNARATGAVEKAHDIIERQFEGCLRSVHVTSLEQLNLQAGRWMHVFNASRTHSRHGMTRYGAWTKIKKHELRIAPPVDICRELARTAPEARTVGKFLTIDFKGTEFNISHVPGVCVNQKVLVCRNPWRENAVQIVVAGDDGHDRFFEAEAISKNEWGYHADAVILGEEYKRHADTPAQIAGKQLDRLITGKETEADVAQAKKSKALPFNGEIDPFKPISDFTVPSYLPRQGTALTMPDTAKPVIQPLTLIQVKVKLRHLLGRAVTSEESALIRQWHPEGVMEEEMQQLVARLEEAEHKTEHKLVAVK